MNKCTGEIYSFHRFFPCMNKARFKEDGKWWCGVHAPSKVAEKKVKREVHLDAKLKEREEELARETRRYKLALACEEAGIFTAEEFAKRVRVE